MALEQLDAHSTVWMNGLQELASAPMVAPLTLRKVWSNPVPVFAASGAGARYWIAPASAPGAAALNQTNVWYFREQGKGVFVDVSPFAGDDGAGTGLYPDAWLRGEDIGSAWYANAQLLPPLAQTDDFGTRALPALARSTNPAQPTPVLPLQLARGDWMFDNRLPHAGSHWEIFFHAPLLIADQLSKQQRFEEADRWLRLVFDPSRVEPDQPQSFLRFRPFSEMPRALSVTTDLKHLAKAGAGATSDPLVASMRALIRRWRSQPYRPFVIARRRQTAFLWRTMFTYLDNLLAWADSLYRRDTREALAEAAMLYVLAARILGPRPKRHAAHQDRPSSSFTDLQGKWDAFANAWFDAAAPAQVRARPATPRVTVPANGQVPAPEGFLFFCVPVNEKLGTYWDLLESRLFNLRHCRNIDGIARDLPLLDPPIDPALLVRAMAAGLDLDAVVRGLYARPLPHRYSVLIGRALDLTSEVKTLGGALLSALEKRDAEALAAMRSAHEEEMLDRMTAVRQLQIDEAVGNLAALRASRANVAARYEQLQRQIGKTGVRAPEEHQTAGEESPLGRLAGGTVRADSRWGLLTEEDEQLEQQGHAGFWTDADSVARLVAAGFNVLASAAQIVAISDQTKVAKKVAKALTSLGGASSSTADAFKAIAQIHQTQASRLATTAGHVRRRDEWAYQSNQALRELRQIDKQLLANEIRLSLTKRELENHRNQIAHAREVGTYLEGKFTSADLYDWMASQLSELHGAAYRMALDMARSAELAAARELGSEPLSVIRNDQWSQHRAGLLAGEKLHRELKTLELTFLERHRREHEMTKHVSLRLLDPVALVDLIKDRECEFTLPEWLFDLDMPGHYMRRLKSVSVSVPCVVGPYASVNCKLTLLRSEVRHDATRPQTYAKADDDDRFTVQYLATESIATSSGRDDSGLFETSLRDERYLPFENAGTIGHWRLEIPQGHLQFDLSTITDVVLHLRYTARDGGADMATAASNHVTTVGEHALGDNASRSLAVLVSCATDFSGEWERAKATNATAFAIKVDGGFMPYWMRANGKKLTTSAHQVRLVRSVNQSVEIKGVEDLQSSSPGDIQVSCPSGFSDHADVLVWADVS